MALDALLLRSAPAPVIRLYGWEQPTLSLGAFQGRRSELQLPDSPRKVVRRMTGGGAIVHDRELTYSIVISESHPHLLKVGREASYRLLHQPIIRALSDVGVEAQVGSAGDSSTAAPFLCFDRTTAMDLRVGNRKLVGSAQRRTEGRILQHGSILLYPSEHQKSAASVQEILGQKVSAIELSSRVLLHFAEQFGVLVPFEWNSALEQEVQSTSAAFQVRT
jgi:lipoate-protein ligase A